MKFIKSVLSISIIIHTVNTNAQPILTGTKFFHIGYLIQAPPNDRFAYTDSLDITYQNMDTSHFILRSGSGNPDRHFLRTGEQIYLLNFSDTVLMYDYSLHTGDTFRLNLSSNNDSFTIDSTSSVMLNDAQSYRLWHLSSLSFSNIRIIWIENLGEKQCGWDYSRYNIADGGGDIKAVCHNNTLIYWNTSFNGFEPENPAPGCDFTSLGKLVSLEDLQQARISFYKNPEQSSLIITGLDHGFYRISNCLGQNILSGSFSLQADISGLSAGIYYVNINSGSIFYCGKFIIY